MFRWLLRCWFARTGRLILRNTNSGESDYTKQSKNFCGHNDHRIQTAGLQSTHSQREPFGSDRVGQLLVLGPDERMCCTRVTGSCPAAREICSADLERAGRLRYPLPGGPDSGMPQVGCGGFRRRLCADETVRGESNSRRRSQASIQNTADQAGHDRAVDIRSGAFRFSLVAGAEIGLILLRQGYRGRS